ncbi:nitrilase-related carbon-nitrogen hydrolase, partial [Dietzia sp. UBA5065]
CAASWGSGPGKVDQWRLLARARALDSTTFLVAVGQADPQVEGVDVKPGAPTGVGHSMLVGPDGTVRAEAGPGAGLVVFEIDDDEVTDTRRTIPVLANGRVTEDPAAEGGR